MIPQILLTTQEDVTGVTQEVVEGGPTPTAQQSFQHLYQPNNLN